MGILFWTAITSMSINETSMGCDQATMLFVESRQRFDLAREFAFSLF
jgi:hypothetical protein